LGYCTAFGADSSACSEETAIAASDTYDDQESTSTIKGDDATEEAVEEGLAESDTDSVEPDAPAVLSPTLMEENIMAMRTNIKEAELLYQDAVKNYENGNGARAEALYHQSLQKLTAAPMNADIGYGLKDDFITLFTKLEMMLDRAAGRAGKTDGTYAIRMDLENDLVKKYLKLYTEGNCKTEISKALQRSGRYREMILSVLKQYDLPEELVYLPVVESMYNNNDLSRAGALGLWQIMPERARYLGLKVNYWIDERKDPEKATHAAARYLKELFLMFDDWHLALAAYNRGEYGLLRDLKFSNATNIQEISERNAVPRETENFVPQFIVCSLIGSDPEKYGFDLQYAEPLVCDTVVTDKIIDLKIVAKCAGTTLDDIRALNPALKAWCTPHNYPHFTLRLPPGTRDMFLANLAQEKDLNPSQGYVKYKVRKGDYLEKIAKRFKTTVSSIKEDNRLKHSKYLRVNQVLVIRPGRKYFSGSGK
jgi:membrane-bound lytic murein transglycosylase D